MKKLAWDFVWLSAGAESYKAIWVKVSTYLVFQSFNMKFTIQWISAVTFASTQPNVFV